jgi:predicted esterase
VVRGSHIAELTAPQLALEENSHHGRLAFRPQPPVARSAQAGLRTLDGSAGTQLGLIYVPPALDDKPLRLVLLLHGAGGSAWQGLELMLPVADRYGLLLLAPKSRLSTWDVLVRGYGPDVRRIDRLLAEVSAAHPIDRLTVGGFSDGASYALSLGVANGDLFDSVVAFSPGCAVPMVRHGTPRLFVSHGIQDTVLPIDRCSRQLVTSLEQAGYSVTYLEFDGAHTVPVEIMERAATWLAAGPHQEPEPAGETPP